MTVLESPFRPRHRLSTSRAYDEAVACVIARMRESADAPLDLAEMADTAGVSRCHFDRVFRDVTGVSPRHFQTALRLQSASRLLLTTTRNVTDICFDVGYESLGSFTTRFTQTFGLPPQKLRELADRLDRPWSEWLLRDAAAQLGSCDDAPRVTGRVSVPSPAFEGLIFVGLFTTRLPLHAPVACSVVTTPGPYTIGSVPDGAHYVLAVAMPWSEKPLEFLLDENTLRGGNRDPVTVTAAEQPEIDIDLRPPQPLDPPINLALPFLIVQKMVGG